MNKRSADGEKETDGQNAKKRRLTVILVCAAVLSTICFAELAMRVMPHRVDLSASQRELSSLPEMPGAQGVTWSTLDDYEKRMRRINPDYVGVIRIEGVLDYPVVRGEDNVKYLSTSYGGDGNAYGAIFMDYRCAGDDVPHIIIYGHNAVDTDRNSYLFNGLQRFLDEQFMAAHPVITFVKNDAIFEFEVFSARITDISDPAYQLDFSAPESFDAFLERNGAPPGASQILTLSTCYVGGGDDGRLVVQGALRNTLPIDKTQTMVAEPST